MECSALGSFALVLEVATPQVTGRGLSTVGSCCLYMGEATGKSIPRIYLRLFIDNIFRVDKVMHERNATMSLVLLWMVWERGCMLNCMEPTALLVLSPR